MGARRGVGVSPGWAVAPRLIGTVGEDLPFRRRFDSGRRHGRGLSIPTNTRVTVLLAAPEGEGGHVITPTESCAPVGVTS